MCPLCPRSNPYNKGVNSSFLPRGMHHFTCIFSHEKREEEEEENDTVF
jgi:hypothetical protein